MRIFEITHISTAGILTTYEGIFLHPCDAIRDCLAMFGMGKIKVVPRGK